MKIITISREFGSGGRELGKRMADILGFDYYDQEVIQAVAQREDLSEKYVESVLESGFCSTVPLTYRRTLSSVNYNHSLTTKLLYAQSEVVLSIAKTSRDCIIVGRNADILLCEYHPLRLFVYADVNAKVKRCMERAAKDEHLTQWELKAKMKQIDTVRRQSAEIISGRKWGSKEAYHLMVNTTDQEIKTLAASISAFANQWFDARTAQNRDS